MKISGAFCLAVLFTITITQLCVSSFVSNLGNEEIDNGNGTDIRVTEPELMEIILTNHELTFEICTMNCFTSFLVCYEPDPPKQIIIDHFHKCDTGCGFYVSGDEKVNNNDTNIVCYMDPEGNLPKNEQCDIATMSSKTFKVRNGFLFPSCKPKIENGLIELNVTMASSNCSITIKNAQFKYHPTTTVLPSNNGLNKSSSANSPSGSSSLYVFGNFGWIIVFVSIYVLQL